MFAVSLALLANAFQGRDRGTAFGIWGATTGAAVAIGPLVGGVLTEWAGWRWIFFVNIPIGVAAIVLTMMRVDESKSPHPGRVDWLGTAALTSSLFLLVYGLLQGNQEGWSSTLIRFCLIGAVVLMAVFVVIELTRRDPMLDIRLFRGAGFVGAQIAAFSISASIFAAFLYLTLYLQNVLGYSPLAAGLRFLPLSLAAFVVAAVSGNLTSRVSARWLMGAGLAIIGVSLLLMTRIDADSGWTLLLPGFVLGGIGIGLTNPALASTAVSVVSPERSGMASGTNSTFRQVGIATGIAGLGALFQSTIASKLTLPDGTAPGHDLVASVASGAFPPAIAPQARAAFVDSLGSILTIAAIVALAGAVLVVVLLRGLKPPRARRLLPRSRASGVGVPSEREEPRSRRLERRDDDVALAKAEPLGRGRRHLGHDRADPHARAVAEGDDRRDGGPDVVDGRVVRQLPPERDLPRVDREPDPARALCPCSRRCRRRRARPR